MTFLSRSDLGLAPMNAPTCRSERQPDRRQGVIAKAGSYTKAAPQRPLACVFTEGIWPGGWRSGKFAWHATQPENR